MSRKVLKILRSTLSFILSITLLVLAGPVAPVFAADLQLSAVDLEPCDVEDPGSQPGPSGDPRRSGVTRTAGASCYVLSGDVLNPGRKTVFDTDVYARILDASGEPVLQNRTRVGSIGDVEPGSQSFALRISVPAGTPGPFDVRNPRARGFNAPVRTRASIDDEDVDLDDLLPLERAIQ